MPKTITPLAWCWDWDGANATAEHRHGDVPLTATLRVVPDESPDLSWADTRDVEFYEVYGLILVVRDADGTVWQEDSLWGVTVDQRLPWDDNEAHVEDTANNMFAPPPVAAMAMALVGYTPREED